MWDQDRSNERVKKQKEALDKTGITVTRLTREMDLNNLSATDVRVVHGVHFYLDITNFRDVVESETLRRDDFKPLHRYMHVVRLELRRIVQQVFDGDKIQVQGPKFHGLLYKPYDDDSKLAWHSVLIGVSLLLTVQESAREAFPDYPGLTPTVGIALGDTIVANIGVRGDRELISIGSAANHAAKLLGSPNSITVTADLWSTLPEKHRKRFAKTGDVYRLGPLAVAELKKVVADEGFDWSVERSATQMQRSIESLPLTEIESHEADKPIDLAALGPKHFKTCMGGTAFVDIDGYTALVDSLLGDEKKLAEAVKLLHLFRYELQQVVEHDFDGVAIQHQGDRLQCILHSPKDDVDKIKRKVVDLCISFNSSVEQVLNVNYAIFKPYHVAIGAEFGKTVVVRSGARGDLDASCFGDAVLDAEGLQLACTGNTVRISKALYGVITNADVSRQFKFDKQSNSYVATGLTWLAVEDSRNLARYAAKAAVGFDTATRKIAFDEPGRDSDPGSSPIYPVRNTRNWGV